MKSLSTISFLGSSARDVKFAAATRSTVSPSAAKKPKASAPKVYISDPVSPVAVSYAEDSQVPQEAKRRAPSAYSFFVKEFATKNKKPAAVPVKVEEKAAEKAESMFKLAASAWKGLGPAEKQRFTDLAASTKAKLVEEGVISPPPTSTSTRPLNSYMLFCQETRAKHSKKLSPKDLGDMWKAADASERKKYESIANKAMEDYTAATATPTPPPPSPPAAPVAPVARRKK